MRYLALLACLLVLWPGQGLAKSRKKAAEKGKPSDLRLTASLEKDTFSPKEAVMLTLALANQGSQQLSVYSHVQADEAHLDWHTVTLTYPVPSREGCNGVHVGKKKLVLRFIGDRDKSAPVKKRVVPGGSVTHVVNLSDWAKRPGNGKQPLQPGFYWVEAVYKVKKAESPIWKGTVKATRLRLTITGTPPENRCQKNPGWQHF